MANKRIILLSDGTGNSAGKVWRTNVWRTFESLDLTSSQQIAFYDDGVGTSSFKPFAILGGAFGFGLKRTCWISASLSDATVAHISTIRRSKPPLRKLKTVLERLSI